MLSLRRAAALTLLCAAFNAGADELDDEAEAIRARVPFGTAFAKVPEAMKALGFDCSPQGWKYKDLQGRPREMAHYVCLREEPFLVVCKRRSRATVLQENGRVVNVIVNVGRFCLGL
jgi:hypothetical protein